MAVTRVFGTVNGTEVEFERNEKRWSISVPFDKDAEYVVAIIAEDEAGNRSYMAKMLVVVNSAELKAYQTEIPYYAVLLEPMKMQLTGQRMSTVIPETSWYGWNLQERFTAFVIDNDVSEERRYECSVLDSTWEKTSMCGFGSVP